MCFRCRALAICERIDALLADEETTKTAPTLAGLLGEARNCIATYRNAEIVHHEMLGGNYQLEAVEPGNQPDRRH